MEPKKNKLRKKLNKNAKVFNYSPKAPIQSPKSSYHKNSDHIYMHNFPRLSSYNNLHQIQETFLPSKTLNCLPFGSFDLKNNRYVIITSTNPDDIHKSLKYGIWTSTKDVNIVLMKLFNEKRANKDIRIIMIFKLKGNDQICGCAELISDYIEEQQYNLWWERVEWKGLFNVKWLFMKNLSGIYFIPEAQHQGNPAKFFDDQIDLGPYIGERILQYFCDAPFYYKNSLLKLFNGMDEREDDLISKRSTFKISQ